MNKAPILLWIAIIVFGLSLSGCGKVSNLTPIEGSGYPHSYPRK